MGIPQQPTHRRRRGQSLAELAVAVPVIFLLLMGGFDASMMVSDKVTAGSASRQGARLAAELGGIQTNPSATTAQIDAQIVKSVLLIAQGMTSATIKEIDIYQPGDPTGVYEAADPIDQYFISAGGGVTAGTQTFPIQNRFQTPPNETSIGVRMVWDYHAPAGIFPKTMTLSDYTVMKAAPILI